MLIEPTSRWKGLWDVLVFWLVIYTICQFNSSIGFLGTMEYLVVVCFAIDIVVRFFTPVFVEATGTWIKDPRVIAYRYATTWLVVDLVSTLPWDNVCAATGCRDAVGFNFLGLLRLLRTLRSNRVLRLWERQVFVPYAWINLLRFIVMILFSGHYMACILRIIPVLEFGPDADLSASWLGAYNVETSHPRRQYILALYHSIMTLSTVGYGDVVMQTDAELWFSILAMLIGVSLYAYIVGEATTLISWMRRSRTEFENQMDTLGSLVKLTQFNRGDRVFLRHFLFNSRVARAHEWRMRMLLGLSPALRAKAMLQLHGDWLLESKLFGPLMEQYVRSGLSTLQLTSPPALSVRNSLASESEALLALLVSTVRVTSYAPYEVIVRHGSIADRMYAVFAGVVVSEGMVKTRGTVFGEDFLLTRHQRRYFLTALKFTVLGELHHSAMYDALHSGNFENARVLYNRLRVTLAWHRRWLPHAQRMRDELQQGTLQRDLLPYLLVPASRVFAPASSRSLFKDAGQLPTPPLPPSAKNTQAPKSQAHAAATQVSVASAAAAGPAGASITEEDLGSVGGSTANTEHASETDGSSVANPLSPPPVTATTSGGSAGGGTGSPQLSGAPYTRPSAQRLKLKGASAVLQGPPLTAQAGAAGEVLPERARQLRRRFHFAVSVPGGAPLPSDAQCGQLCAWFGVPLAPAQAALGRARTLAAAGHAPDAALQAAGLNAALDSGAE